MSRAISIARTGMRQLAADPMYMLLALGMPVLMTWIMSFLPVEMAGLATSGVVVMFLGLNLMMAAGSILEEKQNGTWQRMLVSPASKGEIMAGYLVKLMAMGWAQAAVLLLAGKFVFRAPWSHMGPSVLVVLAAYILAMSGLGLLLAGFLKTQQQLPAVASGFATVGTMLGGVFFPAEGNKVMMAVSKVSPQGWAARSLNSLMAEGSGLSTVATPVIWMVGLGCLFIVAGVMRIGHEA